MSSDPRFETVSRLLASLWGRDKPSTYDRHNADDIIIALADADKAAGIYRVSLDAAVEEAAKAFCRIHLGDVWDSITEPAQAGYRDYFRDVLTAAVMSGAQ